MVKLVAVSDAHLLDNSDMQFKDFMNFLLYWSDNPPENFVLLGDIFDFYCDSNRVCSNNYANVIEILNKLSQKTNLIIIEGNHEFTVKIPDLKIYREKHILKVGDKKIYLSHGDIESSYNISYLYLRKFLHSKFSYFLCKTIPDGLMWKVATGVSNFSKNHQRFDDYKKINNRMIKFARIIKPDVDVLIFGHSHKSFVYTKTRPYIINTGSWFERNYVIWENNKLEVKTWRK